jgi:hypothetical protein
MCRKWWVCFCGLIARNSAANLIVPTLRVGMHLMTLCVTAVDAERWGRHYHAERENDQAAYDFNAFFG